MRGSGESTTRANHVTPCHEHAKNCVLQGPRASQAKESELRNDKSLGASCEEEERSTSTRETEVPCHPKLPLQDSF